jgi:surfactin synthase thioesterase subunit/glycosyltransferase involved in cell wall biosynthesis
MRVLLAHNSTYYPSHGGGDKSNRLLMEALAARGHQTRVVARIERFGPAGHEQHLRDLGERSLTCELLSSGATRLLLRGVDVRTLTLDPRWRAFFAAQMEEFQPDVIVTSTDDPAQLLFDLAVKSPSRVVYLVRATIAVPFGPESSSVSAERTAKLQQADLTVGVSHYVAGYCRREGGLEAVHVPISLLEPGTPPLVARFDSPYVTFVNPCAVKGIDIFLALADRLPQQRFAAVPTWGTTAADRAAMAARPNIDILNPMDQIDQLLSRTRITLVPSVWAEARSRMIAESLSRGVPVMASDVGGIREAMLGVDYLLPVSPVEHYQPTVDEHMVPVAIVPPQNVDPWVDVLSRLLQDREHWHELSRRSREAALRYLENLTVLPFEALLEDLLRKSKRSVAAAPQPAADRQRLAALLLKKKTSAAGPEAASKTWFPVQGPAPRLLCLPPAGGGTIAYRAWRLPVSACPALLPGRESRAGTPPVDQMDALVRVLADAAGPFLNDPFAVFGHSMGAGIGFELARELRRRNLPLPVALLVSAARAPQLRRNWSPPPEPSDDELVRELRRLGGIPQNVLDNPDLMRLALPALRADTRLYRNYTYTEEAPLPCPIFAYGGALDTNVMPDHIEAWREQTTDRFFRREFSGGHFFLESEKAELLAAVTEDLRLAGLVP